ncbi:MAG: hypothetical protein HRT35_19895 [Algicola sp.]|nr:hypothetical protein [Algicola sp.]
MSLSFHFIKEQLAVNDSASPRDDNDNSYSESAVLYDYGYFLTDGSILWCTPDSKIENESIINELGMIHPCDYPSHEYVTELYKFQEIRILHYIRLEKCGNEWQVDCRVLTVFEYWLRSYSARTLLYKLSDRFEDLSYSCNIVNGTSYSQELIICGPIAGVSAIDAAQNFMLLLKKEHDLLDYSLTKESLPSVITRIFKFPPQYEIICSQYLLWFGELLASLGIDATVSTENKNGQTFLSIEPKYNTVLTSEIEKALYLYLSLPYSEYLPAECTNDNLVAKVEFQQLQHQIQMFQQQVEVKNSLLELKTAQLESNSATSEALKQDLDAAKDKILLLESLKDSKLEMFEGAIALDEYKIGPVIINPKKIARLFGKKDT